MRSSEGDNGIAASLALASTINGKRSLQGVLGDGVKHVRVPQLYSSVREKWERALSGSMELTCLGRGQ